MADNKYKNEYNSIQLNNVKMFDIMCVGPHRATDDVSDLGPANVTEVHRMAK